MRVLPLLLSLLLLSLPAQAQDSTERPAVLVADQVFITRDRTLVAQGNVEAFQGETRLRARAIRYNQQSGSLEIDGPIVLQEGEDQVVLANAAQLSRDLRNGLLRGARVILGQQLQLSAVEISRVNGRYNQLYKTAVTSCTICETGEAPLWQIRAKRVVHDQLEKQLYFDEAQFLIRNVPVFYLPRLRMPGPGLDRATGFLAPSIRTTSQLGTGIKVPYFFKIGDHRDLTLTPYVSSATRTLEFRYRQAFRTGRIEFNGAITRDDERPDDTLGYLFGYGTFDLRRDYKLFFAIEAVGDDAYLTDYGYSDRDRLKSELTISRARRDEWVRGSLINFQTIRDGEINENQPTLVLLGEWERRFFPQRIGGELRFGLQAHSHRRSSDVDNADADGDGITDGLDVARLNGALTWLRRDTYRSGFVTDVEAGVDFDVFAISQDVNFTRNHSNVSSRVALALSYPMLRQGAGGATQTLEPVMQVAWTDGNRLAIPNDESTRVEFDEGNLLEVSRFPRHDRRERGAVGAVGLNWSRFDPSGWDAHLMVGRVFRDTADPAFTASSGLSGTRSHFLLAGQITGLAGVSLSGRGLFDDGFSFAKAELRGDWRFSRGRLGGSYVWLEADAAEDRLQDISEITLDGMYRINKQWSASADYRYDAADDRSATAGLGLTYNNECVSVGLSVRRRYSTSTSVEPSTNIGFNVGLRGFAVSSGTESYKRSCRN
ncbi:MAG: LPS assembly protein LptD [Pseudomonadota bacterium]